jgi:hypothetical protein
MRKLSTGLHLSSAFHPQGNGCSERTNKAVGQILRSFTAKRQSRWLESLPAVKHAINSAVNIATGFCPFKLVFGRKTRLLPTASNNGTSSTLLSKWLQFREKAWANARDALWASRVKQALQHNRRHTNWDPLSKGSWALLDDADWRGRHQGGMDKLKERYKGPYQILKVFNSGQSVTLNLPAGDRRHPTFHVSKLKAFWDLESMARLGDTKVSSSQCAPPSVDTLSL